MAGLEDEANLAISEVGCWFEANGLMLNQAKSQLLHFSTNVLNNEFKINAHNINSVSSTKFLGIIIDSSLKWKDHITALGKKLSSACFAIRTIYPVVNVETVKSVYYAYAFWHLRYGVIFWGNSVNSEIIFKHQKRIIRAMFGLPFRQSCKPFFVEQNILTLPSLFIFEILLFYKLNPNLFQECQPKSLYNTRSQYLNYPAHRLTLYEQGPYYTAIKLYNKLPLDIKNQNSVQLFKSSLKSHLINRAYYSVVEYLSE